MVEADAVEAVFQRKNALNFVSLDHREEHVSDRVAADVRRRISCWFSIRLLTSAATRNKIRHGEDRAKIIRWMPPLRRKPGVVEIQPADEGADVERGSHGIENEVCTRHARAVWHDGPWHNRAKQFCACGIFQREQTAAQRIHQTITRRVEGFVAGGLEVANVVRDLAEQGIEWRAVGG